VFDTRTADLGGQPFVLGNLVGVGPGDISASFANPAPAPSVTGQFRP
jgi:hypothetical protein